MSGGYQGAYTVVYSSTGAGPVTVTPTWMPCSTTTARTHSARTRSMAGSRRPAAADAAAGSVLARSVPESVALAQAGSARSARVTVAVAVAVAVIAVAPSGRRAAGMLAVVCMGSLLWS